MVKLNRNYLDDIVKRSLKEDIGSKDVTTDSLIPAEVKVTAEIVAKQRGVISGLKVAETVFRRLDRRCRFEAYVKEGQKVERGKPLAEISGQAKAILKGERVALNFLQRMSGISTLTREFVSSCRGIRILATRKTSPGLRLLELYSVECGGGGVVRQGLWDMALIKDNHLRIIESIRGRDRLAELVMQMRQRLSPNVKIEIEVDRLSLLHTVLKSGPDIIMLDNMNPAALKKAIKLIKESKRRPLIEISGGVTAKNIKELASLKPDRISIGGLTHSAPNLDISIEIKAIK